MRDYMGLSKRAKVRIKAMSASEKKAVAKSAKVLYDSELMGPKRFMEITRFVKRC